MTCRFLLITCTCLLATLCDAMFLRTVVKSSNQSVDVMKLVNESAMTLQVVSRSSLTTTDLGECLCPLGKFWHWNLHTCLDQGAWGYECGFFPEEHHQNVCQDGLKCVSVDTNNQYKTIEKND